MIKLVLIVALFAGVFWAGYYIGQQPPETVKRTIQTLSEDMLEKTLGVERSELLLQREFLEAKDKLIQSRASLLDGNYREAARQLEAALLHLKQGVHVSSAEKGRFLMEDLMERIEAMKQSLASGKEVPQEKIKEAQRQLDALLEK